MPIAFVPDRKSPLAEMEFTPEGIFTLIPVGDVFLLRCPDCQFSFDFDPLFTQCCPSCGLVVGDIEFGPAEEDA